MIATINSIAKINSTYRRCVLFVIVAVRSVWQLSKQRGLPDCEWLSETVPRL